MLARSPFRSSPGIQFAGLSPAELLILYDDVTEELRDRGLTRTANNPVADYSELLFCEAFGWRREENSKKGHDAVCDRGRRYQVKSRRPTRRNPSREVSVLRGLVEKRFDMLAGVLFNPDFTVARAILLPHQAVLELSTYADSKKGWRFHLRDSLWSLPEAEDVTERLRAVRP